MSVTRAASSTLSCRACLKAFVPSIILRSHANGLLFHPNSWEACPRAFGTTSMRKTRPHHLPSTDTTPGAGFLDSKNSPSEVQEDPLSEACQDPPRDAPEDPAYIEKVTQPVGLDPSFTEATYSSTAFSMPPQPSIPWYLQPSHKPVRESSTTEQSAREALPELPPNPPPLLQTLLEYISLSAGLDDLELLDLRHLDPPPALGSNLIMIIGTARSEKHLHVSADRFCRHLRRDYGLRANAAGLLGRNELKIKLRRKAKRMKMLANIGGREPEGNPDDGIRTGWICCTVGRIEAHPEDNHTAGADTENFVGFREVQSGVTVVVQMFTQEKRAEIDLETLWGGVLRTHERRDAQAEERVKLSEGEDQVHQDSRSIAPSSSKPITSKQPGNPFRSEDTTSYQWTQPRPTKGDIFPPARSKNAAGQSRRLHTVGL